MRGSTSERAKRPRRRRTALAGRGSARRAAITRSALALALLAIAPFSRPAGADGAALDIDGDGEIGALTDGLLLLRFAFGFTGATLVNGAVDLANCTRCTAPPIETYLQSLVSSPSCAAGHFDLDGDLENGCEFMLDTQAIYVSTTDAAAMNDGGCGFGPSGSGGGNYPCKTIAWGLTRAIALARTKVRVANGVYGEAIALVNGVSLLGGHRADTWARDVAHTATVLDGVSSSGNHDRTVVATSITSSTVFEGFVVHGSQNGKATGNSYAIYVSGSDQELQIKNNVIIAGLGGPGLAGGAGADGTDGPDGEGRGANPTGYDAKVTVGAGACDLSNNRALPNGGDRNCDADDVGGGNGGGNHCPTAANLTELSASDGFNGQSGLAPNGGAAGAGGDAGDDFTLQHNPPNLPPGDYCFVPPSGGEGEDGSNGVDATDAATVAGCTAFEGSFDSGHWSGGAGTPGVDGGNGGGAGGGGGGGGAHCVGCSGGKDNLGGHGGGGGAGACGGKGGTVATGGGGSFGIFIADGTGAPVVTGNTVMQGRGGAGGTGGAGGVGGLGGKGGTGGLGAVFCSGMAGHGGTGGDGGHGSGGGGGCGGGSFGIYTHGIGAPNYCDMAAANVISGGQGGAGGAGGPSAGSAGGAGAAGGVEACSFH